MILPFLTIGGILSIMFKTPIEYPQCYIIRNTKSEEAEWFIKIDEEGSDLFLKPHQQDFLLATHTVELTSLAEAETYHAFDIAPIGSVDEFIKWIEHNLTKTSKNHGNINTGELWLGYGEYPSCYIAYKKADGNALGVYRIKNRFEDMEYSISWWEKFNKHLFIRQISCSTREQIIANRIASDINIQELCARLETLCGTKKGA